MRILRFSISVLLLVLWACSSHEEFEPPDNPFDPGNPDYVSPAAEIISGPGEGEVIDTTGVTFTWQGNETATEYSYQFDGSGWSAWTTNTSAAFDYLDEEDHAFMVKSRSLNGDIQLTPTALDFSVDAVGGPSAVVYPYRQTGSPGDTIIYQIMAEEVTNLFAVECNISINDDYLELIQVVNGNIFMEWGGNPLVIREVTSSAISVSMVSSEGTNTAFSGSTSMVSVVARIKSTTPSSPSIEVIEINGVTFLDASSIAIEVQTTRSGWASEYE